MEKIGKVRGLLGATALAFGLTVALPGTAHAAGVTCIDSTGALGSFGGAIAISGGHVTVNAGLTVPVDIAANSLPTTVRADYSSVSSTGPWTTNGIAYAGAINPEMYSGDPTVQVGPLPQSGTGYTSGFARFDSTIPLNSGSWHVRIDLGSLGAGPWWLYCRANTTTVWAV